MRRESSARAAWVTIVLACLTVAPLSHAAPVIQFVSNQSYYRTGTESDPTPFGQSQGLTTQRTTNPLTYVSSAPNTSGIWQFFDQTYGASFGAQLTDNQAYVSGLLGASNPVTGNLYSTYNFTDQAVAIFTFNLLAEQQVTLSGKGSLSTSTGSSVANGAVLEPGTYTITGGNPSGGETATFAAPTPEPASLGLAAGLGALLLGRRPRSRA
jgi:hypothetical protein